MKKQILVGALALSTTLGLAGTPTFTSNNDINYGPHPTVGNPYPVAARALGGVIFGDGFADAIFRVANPTTSDGTNDNAANTWNVNDDTDLARSFGSGESFQGISYDGTAYFASGVKGASTALVRVVDTANDTTRWIADDTLITLSPDGAYGGVTAISANNIVMPNYDTGALQFFTVAGATATANGSAIANPNATGLKTTQALYYDGPTQDYIFVYMASDSLTRRIDVFTTNGTPGGTLYAGNFAPGVASTRPVAGHYNQKFANMAISGSKRVLVAAVNLAPSGGTNNNGFDAFNILSVSTSGSATPYVQIRGGNLDATTQDNTAGMAFYNSDNNLAVTHGNRLEVYTVGAISAVSEWSLY